MLLDESRVHDRVKGFERRRGRGFGRLCRGATGQVDDEKIEMLMTAMMVR
jgi:hypothetical protein